MASKAFIEHLKKNEGYADLVLSRKHSKTKSSHGAYYDPKGYLTTGYGSLISKAAKGSEQEKKDIAAFKEKHGIDPFTLTKKQAHSFLTTKILPKYELGLNKFLTENNLNNLSPTQKEGLLDMSFNMGGAKGKVTKGKSGLRGFVSMFKALQEGNIENIEKEAKNSKWFKKDVGRSRSLSVIENLKNSNKQSIDPLASLNTLKEGPKQSIERDKDAVRMSLMASQRKPATVEEKEEVIQTPEPNFEELLLKKGKEKQLKKEEDLKNSQQDVKLADPFQGSFYDQKVLEAKARNKSRDESKRLNEENIRKLAELGELAIRN